MQHFPRIEVRFMHNLSRHLWEQCSIKVSFRAGICGIYWNAAISMTILELAYRIAIIQHSEASYSALGAIILEGRGPYARSGGEPILLCSRMSRPIQQPFCRVRYFLVFSVVYAEGSLSSPSSGSFTLDCYKCCCCMLGDALLPCVARNLILRC
jgi:hypothetical protein